MTAFGRASTHTATLVGTNAVPVEVQVDVGPGLPSFCIVGLGDTAVLEARERVRSALRACGYLMPTARVVVNLAPAPLRKHGTGFDLPIAAALLAATGQIQPRVLSDALLVGELSLDGGVRPVPGMLAHALGSSRLQRTLFAATEVQAIAQHVTDLEFQGLQTLRDLAGWLHPRDVPTALNASPAAPAPDLEEVVGQEVARRALEIAATGGHNLLFIGPPGAGKSMLARRLPPLLPELDKNERIQAALIHSIAGLDERTILAGRRPFRAPHHSCSTPGLIGGGSPPRPGEASLAHTGVLFLDELPEFAPAALQSLRQPLEDGMICIIRAEGRVRFPARFTLIAAANPCPCGYLGDSGRTCNCQPAAVLRYRGRIGGPLMDRIDMHVHVGRVDPERIVEGRLGEPTLLVRERIQAARSFAAQRAGGPNRDLCGVDLLGACRLSKSARAAVTAQARGCRLSGRGVTRLLRVARTIADIEMSDAVTQEHILEAASYRETDRE